VRPAVEGGAPTRKAWNKAWRAAALQFRPAVHLEAHVYGILGEGNDHTGKPNWWIVDLRNEIEPRCDCPAFELGGDQQCKHIVYFQFVEWCWAEAERQRAHQPYAF
jgi:hypothetical protein